MAKAFKHRLGHALFTQKQVFGPRTAKSQPIWIKCCTHLLFYGIHLWADLDGDRREGGSRPNQNDYLFICNTCKVLHEKIKREKMLFWIWLRPCYKIPEFFTIYYHPSSPPL